MAIIIGQPQCCICERKIEKDEAWIATWGVPFVPPHHLYPFCDAPLHISCLEKWPHREEFSRGYFQMFREFIEDSEGHILADGSLWFLGCGPSDVDERPYYVEVMLAHWPIGLRLDDWDEWNHFITHGFQEGLTGQYLSDAETIMDEVRAVVGNQETLNTLHDAAQAKQA